MVIHAGAAGTLIPALDGFGFGPNGLVERLAERIGDFDLAERRSTDQLVSSAGMAGVGEHERNSFGDVIEIDEAKARPDGVGHPIDTATFHPIPFGEAVLHVSGRL